MKKIGLLLFISSLMIISTNCKKNLDPTVDGIYKGTITIYGNGYDTSFQNQGVQLTEISKNKVQVQPYNNGGGSTFTANLSKSGSNVILTIPSESVSGGSIQGYSADPSDYTAGSNQLHYDIQVNDNGVILNEKFTGT